MVKATSSGTYSLTLTESGNSGCVLEDDILVVFDDNPVIEMPDTLYTCADSVLIAPEVSCAGNDPYLRLEYRGKLGKHHRSTRFSAAVQPDGYQSGWIIQHRLYHRHSNRCSYRRPHRRHHPLRPVWPGHRQRHCQWRHAPLHLRLERQHSRADRPDQPAGGV